MHRLLAARGRANRPRIRASFVRALLVGFTFGVGTLDASLLRAHSWYPIQCCTGQDCKKVDLAMDVAFVGLEGSTEYRCSYKGSFSGTVP